MVPVIINKAYGGFGFSEAFVKEYFQRRPTCQLPRRPSFKLFGSFDHPNIRRTDPLAAAIFTEKGTEWSSDKYAKLHLLHVPEDVFQYVRIGEYDGYESLCVNWEKAFNDIAHIADRKKQLAFHKRLMEYAHPPPQSQPPQPPS